MSGLRHLMGFGELRRYPFAQAFALFEGVVCCRPADPR